MRESLSLTNAIKKARIDINELKRSQFIGNLGTKIYHNQTTNQWDYDQDVTLATLSDSIVFRLTFIADEQIAPFVDIRYRVLIDNSEYDQATFPIVWDLGDLTTQSGITEDQFLRSNRGGIQITPIFTGAPQSFNLKIKFHVYATDTGAISIAVAT